MRACRAVPIYFISTLIKRKLIATSLIMLQAAFDDWNEKKKWKKKTKQKTRHTASLGVQARPACSGDNTFF